MGGLLIYFIGYYLFFVWFSVAFMKLSIPNRIYNVFKKTRLSKLLDEWSNCEFCIETWISFSLVVAINIILLFMGVFTWEYLFFAPCSVGLNYLIKGI